jgi:hypothetical protein
MMRRPLAWLLGPVVILAGLALGLAVLLDSLPGLLAWYQRDVLRGVPPGAVVAVGLALAAAGLTGGRGGPSR